MTQFRPIALGLVLALAAPGRADFITSPPGGDLAGNGQSSAPFANVGDANGNRYQQVYSADFFAGLGPQTITSVAFRPKQGAFGSFIGSTIDLSNVLIRLSTTPRNADTDFPNGLSNDLDTNPGADAQTVYSGALSLSTTRQLFDTNVSGFDFLITFQNGFDYRPGLGNLLLDVVIPAGATIGSRTASGGRANNFPQIDSFTDAFPSRDGTASAFDSNLTDGLSVGANSTTGVVTRFGTSALETPSVPAPAGLVLAAVAAATLLGARRRLM